MREHEPDFNALNRFMLGAVNEIKSGKMKLKPTVHVELPDPKTGELYVKEIRISEEVAKQVSEGCCLLVSPTKGAVVVDKLEVKEEWRSKIVSVPDAFMLRIQANVAKLTQKPIDNTNSAGNDKSQNDTDTETKHDPSMDVPDNSKDVRETDDLSGNSRAFSA